MMSHAIPPLDRRGLRRFGLTTGAMVALLFGLALPWLLERPLPLWPWVLAAGLAAAALIRPTALRPLYRGWMRFGQALGWLNTRIVLGLLFYGMILPAGLTMRALGRDPMARRFTDAPSYRVASQETARDRFERPF